MEYERTGSPVFWGFVDFLARQGKTHVRDTAASQEAAVDTAASPEVAIENAVSPELPKEAAVSSKEVDHTSLHSHKRRKRRKDSISSSTIPWRTLLWWFLSSWLRGHWISQILP